MVRLQSVWEGIPLQDVPDVREALEGFIRVPPVSG